MTVLETLQRERAKFGATILPADAVEILNATAWEHRIDIALVSAPAGANGWQHPNGFIRIGHLADLNHGRVMDVFEDGPDREPLRAGPARPQWHDAGALAGIGIVPPMKPIALPPPADPTPTPAPDAIDRQWTDLLASCDRIADGLASVSTAIGALNHRLEQIEKTGVRAKLSL